MKKIRELSRSDVVHPGLPQFQPGAPPNVTVDPKDVPGLRETGWSPECAVSVIRPSGKNAMKARIEEILSQLVAEPRGWAFHEPVDPADVGDYYDVIKNPMDFKTIQQKIDLNKYKSFDSFVDDVQLVFDNCRQYNPEASIYAKNAKHMDAFFKKLLEKQTS